MVLINAPTEAERRERSRSVRLQDTAPRIPSAGAMAACRIKPVRQRRRDYAEDRIDADRSRCQAWLMPGVR